MTLFVHKWQYDFNINSLVISELNFSLSRCFKIDYFLFWQGMAEYPASTLSRSSKRDCPRRCCAKAVLYTDCNMHPAVVSSDKSGSPAAGVTILLRLHRVSHGRQSATPERALVLQQSSRAVAFYNSVTKVVRLADYTAHQTPCLLIYCWHNGYIAIC